MDELGDKIEILSVDLLDRHRQQVQALRDLCAPIGHQLGWHYLLDLVWILENLGDPAGLQIVDAGAGLGLLQWYLLEQKAARVFSVDRVDRSEVTLTLRARYRIQGVRPGDLKPSMAIVQKNIRAAHGSQKFVSALRGLAGLLLIALPKAFPGRLMIYNQDLTSMSEIADNSLDAVVAVSALEHNAPEMLPGVVAELMRRLKPGGVLLATLGAARERDWFHEPSRGWNYTEETLQRLFDLPPSIPSNYGCYDELMATLKDCRELRENLSSFYSQSGDNGMPWGVWDPQYQPVGVRKVKHQ
ncbi:MAG: class I SAM-dependent methyltransferase [Anaerolineales bacterium]|nr:class I SAM-dependent methyltransferase [Anaerolineales bacterium]